MLFFCLKYFHDFISLEFSFEGDRLVVALSGDYQEGGVFS